MSAWRRVVVTVEGSAERKFVEDTLAPHLAAFELAVSARLVITNRKLGVRGGILSFDPIERDLRARLGEDRDPTTRFTTMIDLYALPEDFPGRAAAAKLSRPSERVTLLERALGAHFGDARLLPYIQLHEFEALLFCDLSTLAVRIEGADVDGLAKNVAGLQPEEINEGRSTAPSKRITRFVPTYDRQKVRVGAPAASAIGLATLRAKCPHFGAWVTTLEAIG